MDGIKARGQFRLRAWDKNGKEKWDTGWVDNTVTNASFAVLSGLAGGVGSEVVFDYLAVGTDNTAAAATQTTLGAEITDTGLARAQITPTQVTTTQTDDTLQLVKEWTATGSKTVEEAGVFNDASAGTMLARAVTGSKALANGDKLEVTYKIKFA